MWYSIQFSGTIGSRGEIYILDDVKGYETHDEQVASNTASNVTCLKLQVDLQTFTKRGLDASAFGYLIPHW